MANLPSAPGGVMEPDVLVNVCSFCGSESVDGKPFTNLYEMALMEAGIDYRRTWVHGCSQCGGLDPVRDEFTDI
jgi:hypothetical protein